MCGCGQVNNIRIRRSKGCLLSTFHSTSGIFIGSGALNSGVFRVSLGRPSTVTVDHDNKDVSGAICVTCGGGPSRRGNFTVTGCGVGSSKDLAGSGSIMAKLSAILTVTLSPSKDALIIYRNNRRSGVFICGATSGDLELACNANRDCCSSPAICSSGLVFSSVMFSCDRACRRSFTRFLSGSDILIKSSNGAEALRLGINSDATILRCSVTFRDGDCDTAYIEGTRGEVFSDGGRCSLSCSGLRRCVTDHDSHCSCSNFHST